MNELSVTIRHGGTGRTIDYGLHDEGDGFIVQVNGRDLFAVDTAYAFDVGEDEDGDYRNDPNPGSPNQPHLNIGWWPDGEQWELLAQIPIEVTR